jgi:hypothetical protein
MWVRLTLAQTATFAALWKYWKLSDEDLRALERQIMENPQAGKVMRSTGGVRKTRFAPLSRGSGKAVHIAFAIFTFRHTRWFFWCWYFRRTRSRI